LHLEMVQNIDSVVRLLSQCHHAREEYDGVLQRNGLQGPRPRPAVTALFFCLPR
jgi:hypothetical protein